MYAKIIGSTIKGVSGITTKVLILKFSRIPACKLAPIDPGKIDKNLSNAPVTPNKKTITLAPINAPIATVKDVVANTETSRAAPGMDHAIKKGALKYKLSQTDKTPPPTQTAQIQDANSASESPPACAA